MILFGYQYESALLSFGGFSILALVNMVVLVSSNLDYPTGEIQNFTTENNFTSQIEIQTTYTSLTTSYFDFIHVVSLLLTIIGFYGAYFLPWEYLKRKKENGEGDF